MDEYCPVCKRITKTLITSSAESYCERCMAKREDEDD